MPSIYLIPANQLTSQQVTTWSEIQRTNPILDSAFFRPEFTKAVAAVRDDVEVAILQQHGSPFGFFPFQRDRRNVAQPVVGRLSEFHGVIARRNAVWTAEQLVRDCGLTAWHFDHLVAEQAPLQQYHWGTSESPYLDLRAGFEAYRVQRRRDKSSLIDQVLRKRRKIERDVGGIRFESHTTDPTVFQKLLTWKSAQHQRTGVLEIFRHDWVVALLERIRTTQTPQFSGVLSALYVADRLAAVHLGIRNVRALHIWFPAFERAYEKYSPGLILLVELAKAAASMGIERIDLGKGPERYKASFKSGTLPLAEGSVDIRPARKALRRHWYGAKRWIRSSPRAVCLEALLDSTRRLRQRMAFR